MKGHAETKPKMAFSLFFFGREEIKKSEDRHGGDVRSKCESNSKVGPSPHARS